VLLGTTEKSLAGDTLIGADTEESCLKATISLLSYLGLAGYRVSQKKAQVAKEKV